MTTAGNNITKATITEQFAGLRNTVNSYIVWHAGNHPFNPGASNNYGSNNPAQGSAAGEATGDLGSGIGDTNITASTIVNQFRNYSTLLSRIRYCRLVRYYNTNGSNGVTYDATNITSTGRGDFQRDMNGVNSAIDAADVSVNNIITASGIDTFVNNLSNAIASNRNSTLTFLEYYCHSSCHGSCHGSI